MQKKAMIHIVDDDEGVRKALSLLMKSAGHDSSLYASAEKFLDEFHYSQPCCIFIDVRMPGMSGLELQKKIAALNNAPAVIILTGHGDIDMAVQAMKDGAMDFITKPFQNQKVLDVIQKVMALEVVKWSAKEKQSKIIQKLVQLTPRERQIMQLLVDGNVNKQMASKLDISVRTVEKHRARIMEKLQVKTLAELVHLALLNNDAWANSPVL
jgi:two-component system response regulator FixJ